MSMFKKVLTVAGFGLAVGLMSGGQADALSNGPAGGGTSSANVAVSVSVAQTCAFVADVGLAFPAYNNTTGSNGTATLQLNCTNGSVLNVGVNQGTNWDTVGLTRRMISGANYLPYSLCRDVTTDGNCTLPWGSTVGTDTFTFNGTGVAANLVVNGLIAPGLNVVSGSYADTVAVSVTY
jgi:spore coat protein U-like protein